MFFIKPVYASCPVCIVTVGGGLVIAKKLGIDDLLVSIWLSGLNTAIAFWLASKITTPSRSLSSRIGNFFGNPYLLSIIFFVLTIGYLFTTKQVGHQKNVLWGVDKVLLGMVIGMLVFFLSVLVDKILRRINKGRIVFYYQKVIIPIILLILTTLIFRIFLLQ